MFLGIYGIDEYVPIPPVTHRFSSGAAYAPTAITYSIYEEGNTTGLDEDVDMTPASPFDSVTGFYYARRQLTAAAGFESNKTYVVLVKATVDSVAAIESHVFQIRPLQTGDSYAIVNGDHGLVSIQDDIDSLLADVGDASESTLGSLYAILGNAAATIDSRTASGAPGANNGVPTTNGDKINQTVDLTAGQSIACSDKTGFKLAADGGDLILKSSTFIQAIVAAINEFATYGLTALNTLLTSTGIKTATTAAPTDMAKDSTVAKAADDFNATQKASITSAVPTASAIGTDAASKVLVTPAQKIVTDASGYVTYSNAAPPSAADFVTAMETNGSKLDHLWEMTEDAGGTRRLTTNALEQAPSGSGLDAAGVRAAIGMVSANLDTQLGALPTAAENANAVCDELLAEHTIGGSVGAGISAAGSAGDPWSGAIPGAYVAGQAGYILDQLLDMLSALYGGIGSEEWEYTVTNSVTGLPIDGVEVWITTDIEGTNAVAYGITNSSGTVILRPDVATGTTVYVWRRKTGIVFTNPDTEII